MNITWAHCKALAAAIRAIPQLQAVPFAAKTEPIASMTLRVWREKEQRWEDGPEVTAVAIERSFLRALLPW